jgi:carbon monoxide dehydrogenase subunit G
VQSFDVTAPLDRVWQTLLDIERVAPCLPGAQITGAHDGIYEGEFHIKLGPATAAYRGTVELQSVDEQSRTITMRAVGQDKHGQGSASATIVPRLTEAPGGCTHVEVITDFLITGRLARFGRAGMIQDIANRLMRQFAACLERRVSGDQAATTAPAAEPGAQAIGGFSLVLSALADRLRHALRRLLKRGA